MLHGVQHDKNPAAAARILSRSLTATFSRDTIAQQRRAQYDKTQYKYCQLFISRDEYSGK
jgi:hypothetical protein